MDKERRFKVMFIDKKTVLDIVCGFFDHEAIRLPDYSDNLPKDAVVVDVLYFFENDAFGFKIWSSEFEIVPMGYEIPRITEDLQLRRHTINMKKAREKGIIVTNQ